jgi:hypothetical protein
MKPLVAAVAGVGLALSLTSFQAAGQTRPATNDPAAVFDRGMFLLPSLTNPKDAYTVVIEVQGDKPRSLALPAGSTGIRFADAALPAGAWSWRYTVQRADLPVIQVLEPVRPNVTYSELLRYSDAVHLSWAHVKGATKYRLATRTDKGKDLSKEADWGTAANLELSSEESVNLERNAGFHDLPLKSGGRVEWTVTALDVDGQPLAKSAANVVTAGEPWSHELSRKGWKLQRSDTLSKESATKAAIFGYSTGQKEGGARTRAYQSEFAIIWDGTAQGDSPLFYPRASLEARLTSSGEKKDNDALKFRLGGYRSLTSHPAELVVNLKYETESKGDTKKGLIELAYTPLVFPLGRYLPQLTRVNAALNAPPDALPWIQWMAQVTLGGDVGKTFSVGTSKEVKKTNFRQQVGLRIDSRLNALASALRIPQVELSATSTYWHLSREEDDEHTYSTLGMTFQLTKELSIEAAYSVGADSPKFTFSRSGTVGLGLKF